MSQFGSRPGQILSRPGNLEPGAYQAGARISGVVTLPSLQVSGTLAETFYLFLDQGSFGQATFGQAVFGGMPIQLPKLAVAGVAFSYVLPPIGPGTVVFTFTVGLQAGTAVASIDAPAAGKAYSLPLPVMAGTARAT